MKKISLSLNYFLTWILASLAIFTAQNVVQAQTFQDSTFSAGWSDVLLPNSTSAPATCAATLDTTNGNPAPSRATTHTYGMGKIYCAHLYAPSAYNPATQGQIVNLSYSYDLKHLQLGTGKVAYSILVYQSNTYYYHVPNDLTSSNVAWTGFTGSNLTATSFTKLAGPSSNANPDFSCAGSPIVFGYVTANSNTIPGKIDTTKSGIDNWNVTITTTPCCVALPPIQDSTFSAGWSDVLLPNSTSAPATCAATLDTTNGNPAPSRATTNTYYYHVPNDLTSSNVPWTNFKGSNLTAASFTKLAGPSSNANPDFSCAGSPIVFGYVTVNSNTIPGWIDTTKSGIDNWNVTICQAPCCASQPANMVAWWPLDEVIGAASVNDIAGFNNQGIPKPGGHVVGPSGPGPWSVTGEVHGALYFVGPYIEVAPQAELDFGTGDFSIDAWVKPAHCSAGAGSSSGIVDKFKSPTGYSFYLDQPAVGVAHLYLKINNSPTFVSSGTISTLSPSWSHVAVTVARPSNGTAVGTFYINGLSAGSFTPPAGSVTNTLPLWIGKTRIYPSADCDTAIDELELFNRALLPNEIKSIADAKSVGKCP